MWHAIDPLLWAALPISIKTVTEFVAVGKWWKQTANTDKHLPPSDIPPLILFYATTTDFAYSTFWLMASSLGVDGEKVLDLLLSTLPLSEDCWS